MNGQAVGPHRVQALLKAAEDAKERASLEDMVKSLMRSPEMMALAHEFTQFNLDEMRALPAGDPGRRSLDEDELSCRANLELGAIVSLSRALRGRVRDAGPIPSSGLERCPTQGEA